MQSLYYILNKKDPSYKLNMSPLVASVFLSLFDDDSWSWSGLATLLKARYTPSDIDELIRLLKGPPTS